MRGLLTRIPVSISIWIIASRIRSQTDRITFDLFLFFYFSLLCRLVLCCAVSLFPFLLLLAFIHFIVIKSRFYFSIGPVLTCHQIVHIRFSYQTVSTLLCWYVELDVFNDQSMFVGAGRRRKKNHRQHCKCTMLFILLCFQSKWQSEIAYAPTYAPTATLNNKSKLGMA